MLIQPMLYDLTYPFINSKTNFLDTILSPKKQFVNSWLTISPYFPMERLINYHFGLKTNCSYGTKILGNCIIFLATILLKTIREFVANYFFMSCFKGT